MLLKDMSPPLPRPPKEPPRPLRQPKEPREPLVYQPHHRRIFLRAPSKAIRERHKSARIALIRRREELQMSRPELAGRINVCRHYVFSIETGNRNPSLALMQRWARALGGAPLEIFTAM